MRNLRRIAAFTAKIIVMVVVLWMLYRQSQLQFNLLYTFIAHYFMTLAIFALCYVVVLFHAWRWFRLNAAQKIELPLVNTILPAYIAIAFNNVLPGSVGGDFFRLYFVIKKFPAQKSNTILSIFIDRVIGLLGIFIIACVVTPFYMETFRAHTSLFYLFMVSLTVCALIAISFVLMVFLLSSQALQNIKKRLSGVSILRVFLPLLDAIFLYRNAKAVIIESLIVSVATQLLLLSIIILTNDVMGLPSLPVGVFMLALVMGQIANLVPLTPGGIGVGEAAFGNVIYLLHPGTAAYATVFFALRLLSTFAYIPGVLIGILGYHSFGKAVLVEPLIEAES